MPFRAQLSPQKNLHDVQRLKVVIASTPKTGNTWLEYLLSTIYDLPIVDLAWPFDTDTIDALGDRWVGHQHYAYNSTISKWGERENAVFITTIRHPGDVLVSLYYHVRNNHQSGGDFGPGATLLVDDDGSFSQHIVSYIANFFYIHLNTSITWIHSGKSYLIRYEDLWRDPVTTLVQLTEEIHPVTLDRIERAVEQSDIDLMRKLSGLDPKFFRQGAVGGWRRSLPLEILSLFRECNPYPAQFAAMGYTLDPLDPIIEVPAQPRHLKNPFRAVNRFDNGVPVPAVVVRLYLSFDTHEAVSRWPDVADTRSPNSFYAWLNAPADQDPHRFGDLPIVTNLGAYLYQIRPDLQKTYPDLYGKDRVDWAFWFIRNAQKDYELSAGFTQVVQESLSTWGQTMSASDPRSDNALPPITNLAAYVYQTRPDVQAIFPDLYGEHRIKYLVWLFKWSDQDPKVEPALAKSTLASFLSWANVPDPDDPHQSDPVLRMTRLAIFAYRSSPELQQAFPDIYGEHRVDYLKWFLEHYAWVLGVVRPVVASWAELSSKARLDL